MTITITNNTEKPRFEAHLDGELAGFCEYNLLSNAVMYTHTEVLPAFEGKGVGSALARHVLEDARTQALPVIPACQFIAGYIRKHREYLDVVQPASLRAFHIN